MEFEPVSYDHAAGLTGERPGDVSRDAELLAAAHLTVLENYDYDIAVVGLYIYNVEAEIYGCEISDPGGNEVPSAGALPLNDVRDILPLDLDPAP
ncbi:MAG: hypothetical protein ACLFWL_02360 [Candidatus Brocadiia bacterium]